MSGTLIITFFALKFLIQRKHPMLINQIIFFLSEQWRILCALQCVEFSCFHRLLEFHESRALFTTSTFCIITVCARGLWYFPLLLETKKKKSLSIKLYGKCKHHRPYFSITLPVFRICVENKAFPLFTAFCESVFSYL